MVMTGPLAPWAAGMAERLELLGYARYTAADHMRLVGKLSWFLQERGLVPAELSLEVVAEFLCTVRTSGRKAGPTPKTLTWLLDYLVEIRVVAAPVARPPVSWEEELLERYQRYLAAERGLVQETIGFHTAGGQVVVEGSPRA